MIQLSPIFKDDQIQAFYSDQGYVILELGDKSILEDLSVIVQRKKNDFGESFFYSMFGFNSRDSLQFKEAFKQILKSTYEEFFIDYTNRNESFLVKPPSLNEEMALHQDWSFTDLQKYQMGTFWLPLQDVNEENGCMVILPKSQNLANLYCSNTYETARIPIGELEGTQTIPLKKGQVLFFNPAVFHGSLPNLTAQNRIVVTAQIYNEKAPYLYYHKKDEHHAQVFQLKDDDLYARMRDLIEGKLDHFSFLEEVKYEHETISRKMLNMK